MALDKKRKTDYTFAVMRKPLFCILCLCAGIGFFACNRAPGKKYIAFYALPPDTVQALQTVLKDRFSTIEQHFEWKIVDTALSVTEFMEKNPQTEFVFSTDNRSLFEARRFFALHSIEPFQNLPSTFLNNTFVRENADKYYAFPLLIDPVKLACNNVVAEKLGLHSYIMQEDFERLHTQAVQSSISFPFVCAGGEDEQLFAMVSAVASMNGLSLKPTDFSELGNQADLQASCPPALKTVLDTLVEWRKQGFLHPEWFRLIESDIAVFMEFNSTALAAMPLSASRRIKNEVLQRFITMQIPLPQLLSKKNMSADTVVWAQAVQDESKPFPQADEIRAFLYLKETDEALARATGLAPAFSAAQTQDAEASSGRYWVASSNTALPSFGNIACTTEAEKTALAAAIRRYLEVNGVGY